MLAEPGLRPTPDRVRETLFNWLGQDLSGWRVLDAFAGTGALGFEAASRGAVEVVLLEQAPRAAAQLQQAAVRLGATMVEVRRTDALACCTQRISQLLAAHERALAHLGTAREDALRRMAPRLGLTPTEMDAAFSGIELPDAAANRTLMSGTDSRLAASAQRMALTMLEQGLLQRRVDTTRLIDDRFVRGTTP